MSQGKPNLFRWSGKPGLGRTRYSDFPLFLFLGLFPLLSFIWSPLLLEHVVVLPQHTHCLAFTDVTSTPCCPGRCIPRHRGFEVFITSRRKSPKVAECRRKSPKVAESRRKVGSPDAGEPASRRKSPKGFRKSPKVAEFIFTVKNCYEL